MSVEKAGFEVGQKLDVKYIGKNEKGQMRLSRRAVLMRDSTPTANNNANTSNDSSASQEKSALSKLSEASEASYQS
jgi:predicted RNA-binding protein with RPS1 domain